MKSKIIWFGKFAGLLGLYFFFFILGTIPMAGKLPETLPEPGLLPNTVGLLLLGVANTCLIIFLVHSSRWRGWKLALLLSLAYYGAVTFLTQIETAWFLTDNTVTGELLPYLFIMGLPVPFIFIPLAIRILGKWKPSRDADPSPKMTFTLPEWIWKTVVVAGSYVILYWCAGYFIAWQNPDLRAFYGSDGAIKPFWELTQETLTQTPGLLFFQLLRGTLWLICALPVIFGSRLNLLGTAILVGLFLTIPQTLGLILENPMIPSASVRLSHMIEGMASNFVFGIWMTWLFFPYRKKTTVM